MNEDMDRINPAVMTSWITAVGLRPVTVPQIIAAAEASPLFRKHLEAVVKRRPLARHCVWYWLRRHAKDQCVKIDGLDYFIRYFHRRWIIELPDFEAVAGPSGLHTEMDHDRSQSIPA